MVLFLYPTKDFYMKKKIKKYYKKTLQEITLQKIDEIRFTKDM
jgi:hypothetical protein